MKLAIATCIELPEPDVDESLLMEALKVAGVDAKLAAWDDPSIDWSAFDLCVIRSTWNYPEFPMEFRDWVQRVAPQTRVLNPAETILGNIHKSYLLDLAAMGVPVVPTTILPTGSEPNLNSWRGQAIVIKPAISAGSWLTKKFGPDDSKEASDFLTECLATEDMMVQPYLDSVERGGEVAWVWIDRKVTHGVSKSPRFHEGIESVSTAVTPREEDLKCVEEIMAQASPDLLYARIDLMEHEGQWLLSELELIEPSLFFKQNVAALDRFVQAVKTRMS